jgi:acyl carrier protein
VDVLNDVIEVLQAIAPGGQDAAMTAATMLTDDLGMDSLRLVQAMTALEEKYGFEYAIEDLDPRHIASVGDLVAVTRKTLEKEGPK